jgi:O-methyltransferase
LKNIKDKLKKILIKYNLVFVIKIKQSIYRIINNFLHKFLIILAKYFYHYHMEHLICNYNNDFMHEINFVDSYEKAMSVDPSPGWSSGRWEKNQFGAWILYTTLHFSKNALTLEGDLVECGTYKGRHSIAILNYIDWNTSRNKKKFYLFDTFEGLSNKISDNDDISSYEHAYKDYDLETVQSNFSKYDGIEIIKGVVPFSLNQADITKVSFLHIDMNSAKPEVEALDYFLPLMVKGGAVVLDDYGQIGHEKQKKALDAYCKQHGKLIYTIPTGQGLIIT